MSEKPRYSACIELLFTDKSDDFVDRIHLARAAEFTAVEFWLWSNKDLDAVEKALQETGIKVIGFCAEPMISLADPTNHARFLQALPASIAVAQRLGAKFLYVQGGSILPDTSREVQTETLTKCLTQAADILHGSGVTLLLEPVSDAKNGFLERAADGLPIVAAVNRPEVRLLFDIYHAAVADEPVTATVGNRTNLIGHIHVADHPGRRGPGTGTLDISGTIDWFLNQGYAGHFGMEHRP